VPHTRQNTNFENFAIVAFFGLVVVTENFLGQTTANEIVRVGGSNPVYRLYCFLISGKKTRGYLGKRERSCDSISLMAKYNRTQLGRRIQKDGQIEDIRHNPKPTITTMENADPRSKFFQYKPGDDVGPLVDWPFDNPASNYVILEGSSPLASGRIDHGGPGHTSRFGIWKCTKGVFSCTEKGDEMFTILSGKCRLIDHTRGGVSYDLGPSDSLFVLDGSRVTWDITEDVVKVFYGQKVDKF
jgi:uncharacterized cupin superfamily protein